MKKSEMNIELAVRYLTESASDEERKSFELWLSQELNHRNQFETFRSYWEITGSSYDNYEPDLKSGWEKVSRETVHKKVETFRQKSVSYKLLRIAAIFVLLLAGTYGVRFVMIRLGMPESQLFTYSSMDSMKKFELRDGSYIWLNSNSVMRIPNDFNINNRSITLDGEAYFEIASDKNLPFVISAGGTVTEVVGTSFNIRANKSENKVRVTVLTGKVTFYPVREKASVKHLLAGDRGVYNTSSKEIWKEARINTSNDLAWKTGTILFKDATLSEVCEILSDYYKIKVVADPQIAESKNFTGNFKQASLAEVLEIIALTLDIEFVKKGNRIVAKP
jgi:transmembrane sensor